MKKILLFLLLFAALLPVGACAASQALRVDFYDVGKADAALITTPDGARILIDTGTNKAGKQLAKRFKSEGIDRIDLMLITHFDKDHVGGADKILEAVRVGEVVLPVYEKEGKQLDQLFAALEERPETVLTALPVGESRTYQFGDVTFSLTAAHRNYYGVDEENDFSIAARMRFGKNRFLFPGDAEEARLGELLEEGDVACDVLKAPYHGRLVQTTPAFLDAAHPRFAFIPDSDEEPADKRVTELLAGLETTVHSARAGDWAILSDGEKVWAE